MKETASPIPPNSHEAPVWRGPYCGKLRSADFNADWNADSRKAIFMVTQGDTKMQFYMARSLDTGTKFFIFFHTHTSPKGSSVTRYATVVSGKHGVPYALAYTTGPDPRTVNVNEPITDQRIFSVSSDGYHLDLALDDYLLTRWNEDASAEDNNENQVEEEAHNSNTLQVEFQAEAARRSTKAERDLVKNASFYVVPAFNTSLFVTVGYFNNLYGERRVQLTDDVRLAVRWKIANYSSSESLGRARNKKKSCSIQ